MRGQCTFCVCTNSHKDWVTASSFSPIKKLGKHSTNQECHYFRLNTGTVSTKKQLHKQEDALSESTLTLNGKLLPLCIQRAPESSQTIISASSHVKSTCETVHFLSGVAGTERTVCPFIHVHKQLLCCEITKQSTFKTQFSVNRKVIHEKMLVMHQISTLQLAKHTKNTNFYFFRILEKSEDCHFKTIQTMTPKNHNIV